MKNKPKTWITIRYKENLFDIRLCFKTYVIEEIRSIDSEVNIAYLLSLEVENEIQNIITHKGTHHAI
jgi:hypothetical protein